MNTSFVRSDIPIPAVSNYGITILILTSVVIMTGIICTYGIINNIAMKQYDWIIYWVVQIVGLSIQLIALYMLYALV